MKTSIIVKTTFVALHQWPDAPDCVLFLRHRHRHIFNVVVKIPVRITDREFEFFMVKEKIDQFIKDEMLKNWKYTESCESIALIIALWIYEVYDRKGSVEVYEDNENGAMVEL